MGPNPKLRVRARGGGPCCRTGQTIMLRNKIQGVEATDPDYPQLSLAERRKKLRIRTYIRLEYQGRQGRDSAIVTDLSLDGMRMRCVRPLTKDEQIEVFFVDSSDPERTGSVRCRVVWLKLIEQVGHRSYEAGLSFEDSRDNMRRSWVKYVLEQLGFDDKKTFQKRKYLRAKGKIPARIFTVSGASPAGEVINLGVGGALLALDEPLAKDSQIHCEICLWRILPALRLPCKVLEVAPDSERGSQGSSRFLHSLLFLGMDTQEVKLLGNYIIFLINSNE